MSNATLRRSRLLVMPAAVLAVACSAGGAPTSAPGTSSAATPAAATPAAATPADSTPAAATTAPATDPPSATDAPTSAPTPAGPVDVGALVPTEAGGITLAPHAIPIADFMGAYEGFDQVLGDLGKSANDVTIVQAQGSNPTAGEVMIVQAFRVAGADPAALMDAILEFWKVSDDEAAPITIGGKELIVQGHPDTQPQYKNYYYSYGDTVFKLAYNGDNFDEQMAALVSELP